MLIWLVLACKHPDGLLTPGTWGGLHYELRVNADSTAELEGDCAHATLADPIAVSGGQIEEELVWVLEGGPVQDSAEEEGVSATLRANVAPGALSGTLNVGGESSPVALSLGEPGELMKCL